MNQEENFYDNRNPSAKISKENQLDRCNNLVCIIILHLPIMVMGV